MSLRYRVGRLHSSFQRWLFSRNWFPLFGSYARGVDWAYDVCRIRGHRQAGVVFDVGANVGQTSLYLLRYFPKAETHAFELAGETARALALALAPYPHAHAHHLALGAKPGIARLSLQSCSESNSLAFHATAQTTAAEEVEISTVDAFCAKHDIGYVDVLKTDAQGYDLEVLRGAAGLLREKRIGFIYAEAGFTGTRVDLQDFAPMHAYLRDHGYRLTGLYEQWPLNSELHSFNVLYFNPDELNRPSPSAIAALKC